MIHILMLFLVLVIFASSFIPLTSILHLHFFLAFFIAVAITVLILVLLSFLGLKIITFSMQSCDLPGCSILEALTW
jgi:hypothetical protein